MKNLKIKKRNKEKNLINDEIFKKRIILSSVKGGGNNSDVGYTDSHNDNSGHWGIDVVSVIDQVDSSEALDKPGDVVFV